MKLVKCINCGIEFETETQTNKCSEECKIQFTRDYHKEYRAKVRLNPIHKSINSARTMLIAMIKKGHGAKRFVQVFGCHVNTFRRRLESQFTEEMNWSNHGDVWEIDHIKPISSFNLDDPVEFRKAFRFTNTRPLEKDANRRKFISLVA